MKQQIMVAAEGGACGNFIGTQIYLMHNPQLFYDHGAHLITQHGSCDMQLPVAALHYDMFEQILKWEIKAYPFSKETAAVVMEALRNPEEWYVKCIPYEYRQEMYLSVTHWVYTWFINDVMKTGTTKIVHVDYTMDDIPLVAANKIIKNAEPSRSVKNYFAGLLTEHNMTESIEKLNGIDNFADIPASVIQDLIFCWSDHLKRGLLDNIERPDQDKNLLTIKFSDIYNNKNLVLEQLSNFTGFSISEENHKFYELYMNSQETVNNFLKNNNV